MAKKSKKTDENIVEPVKIKKPTAKKAVEKSVVESKVKEVKSTKKIVKEEKIAEKPTAKKTKTKEKVLDVEPAKIKKTSTKKAGEKSDVEPKVKEVKSTKKIVKEEKIAEKPTAKKTKTKEKVLDVEPAKIKKTSTKKAGEKSDIEPKVKESKLTTKTSTKETKKAIKEEKAAEKPTAKKAGEKSDVEPKVKKSKPTPKISTKETKKAEKIEVEKHQEKTIIKKKVEEQHHDVSNELPVKEEIQETIEIKKEIYNPHDFKKKKKPIEVVQSIFKEVIIEPLQTEQSEAPKKSKSAKHRARKQEKKRLERFRKQGYDINNPVIIAGVKDPNWVPNFPPEKMVTEKNQINQQEIFVNKEITNQKIEVNNAINKNQPVAITEQVTNNVKQKANEALPQPKQAQAQAQPEKINNGIKPIPFVDLTKFNSERQKDITEQTPVDKKIEIVPVNADKLLSPLERREAFFQNFFRDVERFLISEMLVEKGSKVLVGVSGGVDSVVLLDVLANLSIKYNFSLYVCHYNHNIRPSSLDDENFVKDLSANYNVPFYSSNGKVLQYAEKHGISLEEAARILRYQFYERISRTIHADFLATAHTTDDAAETFLLNLLRGTGLTGLSGIPSRRTLIKDVILIRPLLNMSKQKLIEYAERRKITWREDETNIQDKYTRNKIRLDLIPKLKKDYTPAIVEVINRSAKLLQGADRIIHDYVRTHLPSLVFDITNDSISIKENLFKTFDEFIRGEILQTILMKYFRMLPPSMKIIDRIIKLTNSEVGAICEISKNTIAIKDRQAIIITRKQTPIKIDEKISKTGRFQIGNLVFVLKEIKPKEVDYNNNPSVEYFDANTLSNELMLRNWTGTDEFNPLGMTGKMKVSDFITNEKVSVLERPNVLVLTDNNNEIIWVCKHRISDKFKVTPQTKNVIRIEIKGA